jgi:hypothetical protein
MNDADEPIASAAEFAIMATGSGGITFVIDDAAVIILPRGGSLVMEQEDMAMLKRRGADLYKLVGEVAPST